MHASYRQFTPSSFLSTPCTSSPFLVYPTLLACLCFSGSLIVSSRLFLPVRFSPRLYPSLLASPLFPPLLSPTSASPRLWSPHRVYLRLSSPFSASPRVPWLLLAYTRLSDSLGLSIVFRSYSFLLYSTRLSVSLRFCSPLPPLHRSPRHFAPLLACLCPCSATL